MSFKTQHLIQYWCSWEHHNIGVAGGGEMKIFIDTPAIWLSITSRSKDKRWLKSSSSSSSPSSARALLPAVVAEATVVSLWICPRSPVWALEAAPSLDSSSSLCVGVWGRVRRVLLNSILNQNNLYFLVWTTDISGFIQRRYYQKVLNKAHLF